MPQEIEKKFVLEEDGEAFATANLDELYPSLEALKQDIRENGEVITQGYLSPEKGDELAAEVGLDYDFNPVEQRLRDRDGTYIFTVKSSGGLERDEEETAISEATFNRYWPATDGNRLTKTRLTKPYHSHTAEIDMYHDIDLIVAEIETTSTTDAAQLPPLGKDVTDEKKYRNRELAH